MSKYTTELTKKQMLQIIAEQFYKAKNALDDTPNSDVVYGQYSALCMLCSKLEIDEH